MKKFLRITFLIVLLSCSLVNFVDAEEIIVAVSANFQGCIKELIATYTEKSDSTIHCVFGSSGKLYAQILNGAPIDFFFSANTDYPEKLFKQGLALEKPIMYAKGQLVLWSKKINIDSGLDILENNEVVKIAIADPKIAPYGKEAVIALKKYGIWENVQKKIVKGSNISQVNHFILSESVDVGITSLSSVCMNNNYKGEWIKIPRHLYSSIQQSSIVVHKNNISKEISDFYEYIFSEKSKIILEKYGYEVE